MNNYIITVLLEFEKKFESRKIKASIYIEFVNFLKEKLEEQRKQIVEEVINKINLPNYDHSQCANPQSCIGYQNAESDLEMIKKDILEKMK